MTARRVRVVLPALTAPQAEMLIELLHELATAIWDAHENELINRARQRSPIAHRDRDGDASDEDIDDAPF
jgi:hypothetical protein